MILENGGLISIKLNNMLRILERLIIQMIKGITRISNEVGKDE